MNYDVDYFINKFQAIPEDKWCVGDFQMGYSYCVQGHCGMTMANCTKVWRKKLSETPMHLHESWWLLKLFSEYGLIAAEVNNGYDMKYQQPTPKQRILAALYDIRKMHRVEKVINDLYPELSTTTVDDIISEKVL